MSNTQPHPQQGSDRDGAGVPRLGKARALKLVHEVERELEGGATKIAILYDPGAVDPAPLGEEFSRAGIAVRTLESEGDEASVALQPLGAPAAWSEPDLTIGLGVGTVTRAAHVQRSAAGSPSRFLEDAGL